MNTFTQLLTKERNFSHVRVSFVQKELLPLALRKYCVYASQKSNKSNGVQHNIKMTMTATSILTTYIKEIVTPT